MPKSSKEATKEHLLKKPSGKGITDRLVWGTLELVTGHSRPMPERPSSYLVYRQAHKHNDPKSSETAETTSPGVEGSFSFCRLPSRTHCLTPPLPDEPEEQREQFDQQQSPLFKLPPELHNLIYKEVLGDRVIHIVKRSRERLGHTSCNCNMPPCQEECKELECRGMKLSTGESVNCGPDKTGPLPLLQSCRKIYTAAIDILYTSNTFDFDCMESIIAFSLAVPATRFDSIQHAQLDFRFNMSSYFSESTAQNNTPRWVRTWRIVGSMKSLQHLWVRINWHRADWGAVEEAIALEELDQVKQLQTFEVSLPALKGKEPKRVQGQEPFFHVTRRT